MPFEPARFQIDGLDGAFDGYTDGRAWNGWACPVFERNEAEHIAVRFRAQGEGVGDSGAFEARFDPDADAFVFRDPEDDRDGAPPMFESGTILIDNQPVHVYFIGTRLWTWERVSD